MRILVIGSTSVIGQAIARSCAQLGDVEMAGRRQADIYFDLSNWQKTPELPVSYDVVIHAAADFGGPSDEDMLRAEQVNAVGTLTACRLARAAKAKHFILISSISVEYAEDHPYFNIYALSKRHAEEVAALYCRQNNIAITILRPTQIYDEASECRRHQPLLYAIVDQAMTGKDIHLYGTHDAQRNYLFIEDLAVVVNRIAEESVTGVFACAHPDTVSLTDIASTAFNIYQRGGGIRFITDKPDVPDAPVITDFEIYKRIGYWPIVNFSEGLSRIRRFREDRP